MQLVLASESRYRRELLDRLGVPYLAAPHACDERDAARSAPDPDSVALCLARAKAESLAPRHPGAFILGSDQIVEQGGEILGKPAGQAGALAQLERLQGREHRLITAVALRAPGGAVDTAVDIHRMRMRRLDLAERERYLAADAPLDCCGSYRIEGRGIALFERIEGSDFTAIMGLPLITVVAMLRRAGFVVP